MREKARAAIRIGNIAVARALLERPAAAHDPEALFLLGETFDPRTLDRWGVVGVQGDAAKASLLFAEASRAGYVAPADPVPPVAAEPPRTAAPRAP